MYGFQYMDEDSIDEELICNICTEPFFDPGTMWSCDHIFCRACIGKILNKKSCPICRNDTMLHGFQRATRNLVNMLNKILVRCECCDQVNIERGNFSEHIDLLCPKVAVRCLAGDSLCTWIGPRDQFTIHLTQCTAELRKSFENQFMAITKQIEQLRDKVTHITLQHQQLVSHNKVKSEIMCFDQRYENIENDNQQLKLELSKLNQQSDLLEQRIPSLPIIAPIRLNNIHQNAKWTQNGCTVAGGYGQGTAMSRLCNPYGFYIDDDQVIYIADSSNDRIVKWHCGEKIGQVVAGGRGNGDQSDQLNCPTDVIVDKDRNSLIIADYKNRRVVRWPLRGGAIGGTIISNIGCHGLAMSDNGFLYVTDYQQNEVRRYQMGDPHGIVVAGGNGKGNRLDQLNGPIYVFVGRDNSVYVSDEQNHRVVKWMEGSKAGIIVAGGRYKGNSLEQLSEPAKVIVDPWYNIYVADWGNDRIMSWPRGATQGHVVVGGNDAGSRSNQLNHPNGLGFDSQGNLYVANQWEHQVLKFNIERNS